MSQIDHPGAQPATARETEQIGRCYEQALVRAEAMRRAEILAVQDRLIAAIARLLSRRRTGPAARAYSVFMTSGSGSGAGAL